MHEGLIREQLKETPEKSDRQIAKTLGIDHKTVAAQRHEFESGGEIPHLNVSVGSDGKSYPRQVERKPVSVFNPTKREEKALQNPEVVENVCRNNYLFRASLCDLAPLSTVVISAYKRTIKIAYNAFLAVVIS